MFHVNIDYLNNILKDFHVLIDEEKYHVNIGSLNRRDVSNSPRYLNIESFSKFLIVVSKFIAKFLKEVKEDEYKLSLSHSCIRK